MSHEVTFFRPPQRPNGGTVFVRPSDSGNPYASVEEQQIPVVVVELPEMEDDSEGR